MQHVIIARTSMSCEHKLKTPQPLGFFGRNMDAKSLRCEARPWIRFIVDALTLIPFDLLSLASDTDRHAGENGDG